MSDPADLPKTDAVQAARIIEALVFASAKAIPIKSVLPFLQNEAQLPEILELIQSRYDERSGLSFEVSGDQLAFRTKADIARYLSLDKPVHKSLSRAALEVFSIAVPTFLAVSATPSTLSSAVLAALAISLYLPGRT